MAAETIDRLLHRRCQKTGDRKVKKVQIICKIVFGKVYDGPSVKEKINLNSFSLPNNGSENKFKSIFLSPINGSENEFKFIFSFTLGPS